MTDINEIRQGLEGTTAADKIQELLGDYFDAGVAEGKERRDHDTADGSAQELQLEIMRHICRFIDRLEEAERQRDEARAALERDWTVSASELASEILNYLGIGCDASLEPGADWRRDNVAKIITARDDARALAKEQTNG